MKNKLTEKQLSKLQEQWDKEIKEVKILRVVRLNAREWWIILIGEMWLLLIDRHS